MTNQKDEKICCGQCADWDDEGFKNCALPNTCACHSDSPEAPLKCNCQFAGDKHPHKKDCPAYIPSSGWKESLREKFYHLIENDGITAEDTFALFITEFDAVLSDTRQDLIQRVIEQEKSMFHVRGGRYIVLDEESIEALEHGERRAVPIRSYQFPSVRITPPTMDEFNKHTIILKRD